MSMSPLALRRLASAVVLLDLLFVAQPASAQTIESQYEDLLVGTPSFSSMLCTNLGVVRDEVFKLVVPGQFGPNLTAFCNGATHTQGSVAVPSGDAVSGSSSAAPGANSGGVESGRGQGGEQDAAIHRRQERLREDKSVVDASDATADSELSFGKFSIYLSTDYSRERQEPVVFEGGRSRRTWDFTLGGDYRIGRRGLVGFAVKYGETSGDIDSGGTIDSDERNFTAYGSWLPVDGLFIDAAVGVGRQHTELQRDVSLSFTRTTESDGGYTLFVENAFVPAAVVESTTSDQQSLAELRSGFDWSVGGFTVGPRVAAMWRRTEIDAYTERGDTLMALSYDEQTATSSRSQVGVQASQAFSAAGVVLVPQVNVDWAHEFNDDQRTITAYFAEDLRDNRTQLRFQNQAPDRDWAVVRLNLVAVFARGMSAFAAYERTASHEFLSNYRATAGVRIEL